MSMFDLFDAPVFTMNVPRMFEIRTVPNLYLHSHVPVMSADLPNLELEFKDKEGEIKTIHFNVKRYSDNTSIWPGSFEPKIVEFAKRVAEDLGFEMVMRPHNSTIKGYRSRIKALCNRLYSPWMGASHVIDSIHAPRILRCELGTTTFRAYKYEDRASARLKDMRVEGITGFFMLDGQPGYFMIDCAEIPLRSTIPGQNSFIISDVNRLLQAYRKHIEVSFPMTLKLGMYMELNDEWADNRAQINQQAGAHFFKKAADNGDLNAEEVLNPQPRHGAVAAPKIRWRNATILEIAKRFCESPADFQRFLSKVSESKTPFTACFEVDIHGDGKIRLYSTADCTMPFIVVDQEEVVA